MTGTCPVCGERVPSWRENAYCSPACNAHRQPRSAPVKRSECKRCRRPVAPGFNSFCSVECMHLGAKKK